MTVELSVAEAETLREVLEASLLDLKSEIHHTDDHDFKARLHERQRMIETIIARLPVPIEVKA